MSKYRKKLPQLADELFITDGGLETTLTCEEGIELPHFAAFDLLKNDAGIEILRRYFLRYVVIAHRYGHGIVLDAPTWRANRDWGEKLGYDAAGLADANRKAIDLLMEIRTAYESHFTKLVISGTLGPRGGGFSTDPRMTIAKAYAYHVAQIETFARTDADMITAYTMSHVEESIGIAWAARDVEIPVVISFALGTDGRLPCEAPLQEAIERIDEATNGYPAYYMINCAHFIHFQRALLECSALRERIRGLRPNASKHRRTELDAGKALEISAPAELANQYFHLQQMLPNLSVIGGCCGTDHRHIEAISRALTAA